MKPTASAGDRIIAAASDLNDLALYLSGVPNDSRAVKSLKETAENLRVMAEQHRAGELVKLATLVLDIAGQDLSAWSTVADLDGVVTRIKAVAEGAVSNLQDGSQQESAAKPFRPCTATGWVHTALSNR